MLDTKTNTETTKTDTPIAAYSVESFCAAHGMGRSFFYQILREGSGPRTMKVKKKRLITAEAAADWRRWREKKTAEAEAASLVEGDGQ
jgi:hypothetical protein